MTWANKHADATVVMAYSVLQPITSTALSQLLIHTNLVDQCNGADDDSKCLHGLKWADMGAIGIAIGLFFVIRSDLKARESAREYEDMASVASQSPHPSF